MSNFFSKLSREKKKTYYFYIIGFVLTIGAWSYFLLKQHDKLQSYEWKITFFEFILALLFSVSYFLALAFNWAFLLKDISENNFRIINIDSAIYVWLSTIMSRYIPGKVWHILGRLAFSERINAKKVDIISSSIIEQVLTIMGTMIVVAINFPMLFSEIISEDSLVQKWFLLVISIIGFIIIIHPKISASFINYLGKKQKFFEIKLNFDYKKTIGLLFGYAFAALFSGLALTAIIEGIYDFNSNEIFFIIGSSALAWVIGYLSFITPSGIGVREGALTALLAMIYPMPIAIVASLLFRIICTVGELLAIVIFTAYMKIKYKKTVLKNSNE